MNTFDIDGNIWYDLDFKPQQRFCLGFIEGLGYNTKRMSQEGLTAEGYMARSDDSGDIFAPWNRKEDWEIILKLLPLKQI